MFVYCVYVVVLLCDWDLVFTDCFCYFLLCFVDICINHMSSCSGMSLKKLCMLYITVLS